MSEKVDFWNLAAATHKGMAPGWQWYRAQALDSGEFLLEGGICTERYKSGKRKGQLNWSKMQPESKRTIVLTKADYNASRVAWELNTGLCGDCQGSGIYLQRDCKRCSHRRKEVANVGKPE